MCLRKGVVSFFSFSFSQKQLERAFETQAASSCEWRATIENYYPFEERHSKEIEKTGKKIAKRNNNYYTLWSIHASSAVFLLQV